MGPDSGRLAAFSANLGDSELRRLFLFLTVFLVQNRPSLPKKRPNGRCRALHPSITPIRDGPYLCRILSYSYHFFCPAYGANRRSSTAPNPDFRGLRNVRLHDFQITFLFWANSGLLRPLLPGSHIQLQIPVCHIHKPLSISCHARCDPDLPGDGAWRAADVRAENSTKLHRVIAPVQP